MIRQRDKEKVKLPDHRAGPFDRTHGLEYVERACGALAGQIHPVSPSPCLLLDDFSNGSNEA